MKENEDTSDVRGKRRRGINKRYWRRGQGTQRAGQTRGKWRGKKKVNMHPAGRNAEKRYRRGEENRKETNIPVWQMRKKLNEMRKRKMRQETSKERG